MADAPRGQRIKRSDPTGTFPLQRQFVRDLDARWQRLRKMIPDAVIAKTHGVNVISHAAITGDDPIRAFNSWLNEAMRQLVLGATGAWTLRYMRESGDAGLLRANTLARDVVRDAGPDDEERDDHGRWSAGSTLSDLKEHLNKTYPTVYHDIYEGTGSYKVLAVSKLVVPHDQRNKGLGTGLLKEVHSYADARGLTTALSPSDQFGGNKNKLVKWYKSLGYVQNKGRKIDHAITESMYRPPKSLTKDAAPPVDRIPRLQTLCVTELQGICDAVRQQAVRAFGNGVLNKQSQASIARDIQRVITDIGIRRGHLLVSFMTVRAFNASTLDGFRANGISHVGTVAERVRSGRQPSSAPGLTRDAKKKKKWADPEDLVEVLTAGDDDVCPECQDISDEGPYTLDEAEDLIPAHPNCRCAFVPADDERYASVHDAGPDDEERDDHGRWTAGDPTSANIPADPAYAYHATNNYNLGDIAESGKLKTHGPSHGTDQDTWPDGSTEKRSYWTHDPKIANSFYPEEGKPVLLRARRDAINPVKEKGTGDLVVNKHVDAKHLEVYSSTGDWKKLTTLGVVHDEYDPDEARDDHGMWSSVGGAGFKSYSPPQHGWANVEGQNHDINEPPLPKLKPGYSYTDKTTGKQVNVAGERLSSGVIMREPDGRTWLVKPTNGFGGYNYTFPKGGVEEGLHPQANAIKETWEETGLKARITGWAGDYKGDTSTTRMYHAEREGGHPKDKGWETEQVALAHPDDLSHMLNRSRDKKIAAHHILGDMFVADDFDPDEPRDDHGMWTTGGGGGGAAGFAATLKESGTPHEVKHNESNWFANPKKDGTPARSPKDVVVVPKEHVGPSMQSVAESHGNFSHVATGIKQNYYVFNKPTTQSESPTGPDAHAEKLKQALTNAGVPHEAHVASSGDHIFQVAHSDTENLKSLAAGHGVPLHYENKGPHYTTFHVPEAEAPGLNEEEESSGFPATPLEQFGHIDMQDLTKISGKKGSNEGGVYTDMGDKGTGEKYYIKQPATPDHVTNELVAAKLYQLAGVNTMQYVPVKGGNHVATVLQKLDKDNVAHFTPSERDDAKSDFAVHAWLANHDAVGTGGDNQVVVNGNVTTVDTGGSLKYRAQGEPKGKIFGDKVTEITSMRGLDPNVHAPDAAKLYGDMTTEQIVTSINRVKAIPDGDIIKTVLKNGGTMSLAKQLIARKDDMVGQAHAMTVAEISKPLSAAQQAALAPKTILGPNTTPHPQPPAKLPEPAFKTKMEHLKHLMLKGTTASEVKATMGWKAVSMPDNAAKLGLKLTQTKVNGVFHYKGEPLNPDEAKAVKAAAPKTVLGPNTNVKTSKEQDQEKAIAAFSAGLTVTKPSSADKPSHTAFQKDLIEAGVFNNISPHNTKEGSIQISSSTDNKQTMAKVAASHPQWSLVKGNVATYEAPLSAFSDAPNAETNKEFAKVAPQSKPGFVTVAGHDISTPIGNFKQSLDTHGVKYSQGTSNSHSDYIDVEPAHASKAEEIAKWHPAVTKLSPETYAIAKTSQVPAVAPQKSVTQIMAEAKAAQPPAPALTPPTDAELAKAKKNVALQLQYVPGAPDVPQAHALIAEFNKKYEGKTLAEHELPGKVADFKQLQANMVPLQSAQQQEAVAKQAKSAATAATKKAAAAQAEADKVANLHNLPEEDQREYWLQKIAGSNYLSLGKQELASHPDLAKHGVTPAEVGFVRAFTGPHSHVNEEMRKGHMTMETMAFKHIMQGGLDKMPKYKGDVVYRKIHLSSAEQADYVPGKVSEWMAFNSSSKNPNTWSGNTHFVIRNPKTGVDVQKISSNPSEAEVIMPANSFYKVLSKKANTDVNGHHSNGTTRIEMEEIIPFGKKVKAA